MSDYVRPRGVTCYPLPREVTGPTLFSGTYALVFRDTNGYIDFMEVIKDPSKFTKEVIDTFEVRLVNIEGVAYKVTHNKPWRWSDYDIEAPFVSMWELVKAVDIDKQVDIADHIRTFGARLDSNHHQLYYWATKEQ